MDRMTHLMGYIDKDFNVTQDSSKAVKKIILKGIQWVEQGVAETYNTRVELEDIKKEKA